MKYTTYEHFLNEHIAIINKLNNELRSLKFELVQLLETMTEPITFMRLNNRTVKVEKIEVIIDEYLSEYSYIVTLSTGCKIAYEYAYELVEYLVNDLKIKKIVK